MKPIIITNIVRTSCLLVSCLVVAASFGAAIERGRPALDFEAETYWSAHDIFLAEIVEVKSKNEVPSLVTIRPLKVFNAEKLRDAIDIVAGDIQIPDFEWMGNTSFLLRKGKTLIVCMSKVGGVVEVKAFSSPDDEKKYVKSLEAISQIRNNKDKNAALLLGVQSRDALVTLFCLNELLGADVNLITDEAVQQLKTLRDSISFSAKTGYKANLLIEKKLDRPTAIDERVEWIKEAIGSYPIGDESKWRESGGRDLLFFTGELLNLHKDRSAIAKFFMSLVSDKRNHAYLRSFALGSLDRCLNFAEPSEEISKTIVELLEDCLGDSEVSVRYAAVNQLREVCYRVENDNTRLAMMIKTITEFEKATLVGKNSDLRNYLRNSTVDLKIKLEEMS